MCERTSLCWDFAKAAERKMVVIVSLNHDNNFLARWTLNVLNTNYSMMSPQTLVIRWSSVAKSNLWVTNVQGLKLQVSNLLVEIFECHSLYFFNHLQISFAAQFLVEGAAVHNPTNAVCAHFSILGDAHFEIVHF